MFSIILAGGEGSRLWPLSTSDEPKPLLKVLKDKTLLELTIERLLSVTSKDKIFIVITQKIEDKVKEILPSFPLENIITEPVGRNTAPCIALATRKILDKDDNAVIGVFPADHIILNHNHFYDCIKQGVRLTNKFNRLVLLGLVPEMPSTGYGYIFLGEKIALDNNKFECFHAKSFIEKPVLKRAEELIKGGDVLWNSGIYIGKANRFLHEIKKYMPDVYDSINISYNNYNNLKKAYESFTSVSIDYAVTEKLKDFIAISTDIKRIDVGNFNALYDLWDRDEFHNAINGKFIGIESCNNIIFSHQKPVAAFGVNNMVVINTPDAILVCPRDKVLDVKSLQEKWTALKEKKSPTEVDE